MLRRSRGAPWNWIKSFSKTSMASNRAAAIASSFSGSVPEIDTVAIDLRTTKIAFELPTLLGRRDFDETGNCERVALDAESDDDRLRHRRKPRVMPERLARVDVRNVELDHRHVGALDRIVQRDR